MKYDESTIQLRICYDEKFSCKYSILYRCCGFKREESSEEERASSSNKKSKVLFNTDRNLIGMILRL